LLFSNIAYLDEGHKGVFLVWNFARLYGFYELTIHFASMRTINTISHFYVVEEPHQLCD